VDRMQLFLFIIFMIVVPIAYFRLLIILPSQFQEITNFPLIGQWMLGLILLCVSILGIIGIIGFFRIIWTLFCKRTGVIDKNV